MKTKFLILTLVLFGLFFIFGCTTKNVSESSVIIEEVKTQPATDSKERVITLQELTSHSSDESCWVSYKSEVYDITTFLPKHPGGKLVIANFCGTANEFQNAFIQKHTEKFYDKLKNVGVYIGKLE